MTRDQWIGAGVVFLLALAFLVAAVWAWHTDPEDVVRKTEQRRYSNEEIEELARDFAETIDLVYKAFDERRANERLRGESTTYIERHDPTVRRFHQAGGYE